MYYRVLLTAYCFWIVRVFPFAGAHPQQPPTTSTTTEAEDNSTLDSHIYADEGKQNLEKETQEYKTPHRPDSMSNQDKLLIVEMIRELFYDAESKVLRITDIVEIYTPALSYEVGKVIGEIQAMYRHMMEIWREVANKEMSESGYRPRTRIWPAGFTRQESYTLGITSHKTVPPIRSTNYYMICYGLIYELESDIERHIDTLLVMGREEHELVPLGTGTIKFSQATKPNLYVPPTYQIAQGRRRHNLWRAGGAAQGKADDRNMAEERYKHRMREQYLLKKLGLNETGHTPRPRFRFGWPVEDTWDNIPLY